MKPTSLNWLTILGSGTGIVRPGRSGPSVLIQSDEFAALVDCGPGTLMRLSEAGMRVTDIDAVLFTHFHIDHCSDLAPLLFARRIPQDPDEVPPLLIIGKDAVGYYAGLRRLYGEWVDDLKGSPVVLNIEQAGSELGPWNIEWCSTTHTENSVAYRFEDVGGATLVISGDTGPSDALEELGRKTDTLILECSFPDPSPFPTHLSPETAGKLAGEAQCSRLILTHFYPQIESANITGVVSNHFNGPIIRAHDHLRLLW